MTESICSKEVMYVAAAAVAVLLLAMAVMAQRLRRLSRHAEEKARELQEARRQEALGTLAGGIAHDFNNILGSIMGFGALLEDDLIAQPELRELAQNITIAAKRGQGIVGQLMSYSRRNRTADARERAPVSLDAVVRENITLLRPSVRSSSHLSYEGRAKNDVILADATQLGQAIVNLCINADHAIGVKAGKIAVTLENTTVASDAEDGEGMRVSGEGTAADPVLIVNGRLPRGDYLKISVADDGEGMTREIAERIFDPFFTTKDVNRGTGLGLAAIQGIILSHGGAIMVKSVRFQGTVFSLMLPAGSGGPAPSGRPGEKASR